MPTVILDGRGSAYLAGVTSDNKLMVDATVNATATSATDYKVSGTWTGIGSVAMVGGDKTGSAFPLQLDTLGFLKIVGSITSMPSVSVTAGSESYVKGGSIQTYNPIGIGSVTIVSARYDLGSYLMIAGSITSMPSVSVTAGSESYIKGGSIQTYSPLGVGSVTGQITIGAGSIQTYSHLGSVNSVLYGTSGANIGLYPLNVISGTVGTLLVNINNTTAISGIVNQGTTPWVVSGTSTIAGIGSFTLLSSTGSVGVNILTSPVPISGIVNQGTSPWAISGVVNPSPGSVYVVSSPGSIAVYGTLSATAGSEQYIKGGSIQTYNPIGVGSVLMLAYDSSATLDSPLIANGSYLMIAGSISSMPSVSVTAGSEQYIKGGSIQTYSPLGIGSIRIAEQGVVLGVSGIVNQGTNPWGINGSVRLLGVSGNETFPMMVTSGTSGGYLVVNINTNPVPISGTVNQGTTPWAISGTVRTDILTSPVPISGIVNIGLGSVSIVNFNALGSNIVIKAGSIEIYETVPISVTPDRGIFNVSGASFIAAGSANIIAPGAGSKILLKGFTASAELATHFRIYFSGGTPTQLTHFTLPNSGTVAMNFYGMEPSGAVDQPLAISLFNGGSLYFTAFTADTL